MTVRTAESLLHSVPSGPVRDLVAEVIGTGSPRRSSGFGGFIFHGVDGRTCRVRQYPDHTYEVRWEDGDGLEHVRRFQAEITWKEIA